MIENLSIYILCGGKSARMGSEKGLVVFNDKTFVEHIIHAVRPLSDSIHLVTSNDAYETYGYPLIPDVVPGKGPVGGIYSALRHSSSSWNLILSCDVPLITTEVLKKHLFKEEQKKPITFLSDGSKDSPLIGLYSRRLLGHFEQAIRKKYLKLIDLISLLPHDAVVVDQEETATLQNINSQKDLNRLL